MNVRTVSSVVSSLSSAASTLIPETAVTPGFMTISSILEEWEKYRTSQNNEEAGGQEKNSWTNGVALKQHWHSLCTLYYKDIFGEWNTYKSLKMSREIVMSIIATFWINYFSHKITILQIKSTINIYKRRSWWFPSEKMKSSHLQLIRTYLPYAS